MKKLAEILYDAIKADEDIMTAVDGRVTSTIFETPPDGDDNTPLPNIIVTNDGFQNNSSNKDCVWESSEEMVQASVDVAAGTDGEVDALVTMVRKAIEQYVCAMYSSGQEIPTLQPGYPSSQGIAWDWEGPCYHQTVTYQCSMSNVTQDE